MTDPQTLIKTLDFQLNKSEDDGSIRIHVIQQQTGTFAEYDGETATNVTAEHDAWWSTPSRCHTH